jgi:3-phosphoshikimate 1-carboxyvinyltransferase
VPRLIDEIPVLAVLATQCHGTSSIRDARELRVKESDRIEVVADGLRRMGATVRTFEDGMEIEGPCRLSAAKIDAQGDHRIAMAFAVAGLVAQGQTEIEGADSIATSYPGFERDLESLAIV